MAAPRFLFVHGAWHGSWCFDFIQRELSRRAVQSLAVDLPAMGDDQTPIEGATFEAGVERVLGLMSGRRSVLVGHSFGAFYATEAALRASGKVRSLVYLCAYVPLPGDSFRSIQELAPLDDELKQAIQIGPEQNASILEPAVARRFLYNDVADGIALAAVTRLKPQPLEPFRTAAISASTEVLKSLDRRALLCAQDLVLRPEQCIAMAERAAVPFEVMEGGHCPFLSNPRGLADQLLGVA